MRRFSTGAELRLRIARHSVAHLQAPNLGRTPPAPSSSVQRSPGGGAFSTSLSSWSSSSLAPRRVNETVSTTLTAGVVPVSLRHLPRPLPDGLAPSPSPDSAPKWSAGAVEEHAGVSREDIMRSDACVLLRVAPAFRTVLGSGTWRRPAGLEPFRAESHRPGRRSLRTTSVTHWRSLAARMSTHRRCRHWPSL